MFFQEEETENNNIISKDGLDFEVSEKEFLNFTINLI